jgi:alpha-L-arabinofuranosidase
MKDIQEGRMRTIIRKSLIVFISLIFAAGTSSPQGAGPVPLKIFPEALHEGRIKPLFYGNFIELLDDVIPGMWAEMLGNRGFEGVEPTAGWVYHQGALNLSDRDWDADASWTLDSERPFNALRSARLTATPPRIGRLTQGGLAVKKGLPYRFTGWFRSDTPNIKTTVVLKALLPDGRWMILGQTELPAAGAEWSKREAAFTSSGTTDRAVFELSIRGTGHLWADKVSLMPGDAIDGWRKDVVEATKEMRPAVLRWGGSTVDPGGYKWKDGIGGRDHRLPFRNPVWGRLDMMDVGIEEILSFCRVVGAEPLLCVSFGDGPASARDMVEYVNGPADTPWGRKRAANGHPAPYGVKYWQVGNEVDEPGYPARCAEFCRVVRAADPAAVILTSFPTPELIDQVKDLADIYCPHYYRSDLQGIDEDIARLQALLRSKVRGRPARLAVTEWNIDAGAWGLGRGKLGTLNCALFEARFLNILHRRSDIIALATRSNLCNSFCGGTIQTNAAGLFRIPAFHVMALYAGHFKPVPLRISEPPAGVDVSACAAEDRRSATIFAVNTRQEAIELEIDASALAPGLAVVDAQFLGDTQDRRQPDVTNFWDRSDRIHIMPAVRTGRTIRLPALSLTVIDCAVR